MDLCVLMRIRKIALQILVNLFYYSAVLASLGMDNGINILFKMFFSRIDMYCTINK
jgi:hypothetical protein